MPNNVAGDTAAQATTADTAPAAPAPELEAAPTNWNRVLIVAKGNVPSNVGRRKVIVVESRGAPIMDGDQVKEIGSLKASGYPKDADLYYRVDDSVTFDAGDAPVFTLGQNLVPKGVGGLTQRGSTGVMTGPGDPAYAGVNLAYHRGATDIEISGLTKADQERLQPWFDSHKFPAGLTVTFS